MTIPMKVESSHVLRASHTDFSSVLQRQVNATTHCRPAFYKLAQSLTFYPKFITQRHGLNSFLLKRITLIWSQPLTLIAVPTSSWIPLPTHSEKELQHLEQEWPAVQSLSYHSTTTIGHKHQIASNLHSGLEELSK